MAKQNHLPARESELLAWFNNMSQKKSPRTRPRSDVRAGRPAR
jgi:hypothetical protein